MIRVNPASDQELSRPRCEATPRFSLAMVILVVMLQGCTANDPATDLSPTVTTTGSGPAEPTEQDLKLLREEVRMQTTHLREIADDLEWRSRSGQQFDRAILLRIEDHVHRATERVERIEILLGRFEKAQR